ncbi:hypothetical protein GCM10011363_28960 [Marivita lacus]|uniref:Uncharacterized protein n=1 Tax=Marivita lacus TaxID=1323742 RepID=A0ABQ1KUE8_9RHOB|nr:hypothetical protein GCM10011363_28960 [Marivita lacus]
MRLGEKGAEPGGVEFLKAALFLRIHCGGQWTRKGWYWNRLAAILRPKDGRLYLQARQCNFTRLAITCRRA